MGGGEFTEFAEYVMQWHKVAKAETVGHTE